MWREVHAPRPPEARGRLAAVLPPFIAALLLWLLGLEVAAVVVLVLGMALLVVRLTWPAGAAAVDRAVLWFADAVGKVLAAVLLTLVLVFVLLPVSLVRSVLRRDLAPPGFRPAGGTGWVAHPGGDVAAHHGFAAEPPAPRTAGRRVRRAVPVAVGAAVLLVAVDLGVGWTYDELVGTHDTPQATSDEAAWPATLGSSPATADDPWMGAYLAELAGLEQEYVPYLISRTSDVDGELITVEDGRRATWEPEGLPADAPVVWVLGGSTVWGEGQRDEHTLPSELARVADEAGRPVRVVNLGERGSTTWQDLLRFEQALAVAAAPDAAVFYGGVNDITAQLQDPFPGPTQLNIDPDAEPVVEDDSPWARYREHSVLAALADWAHEAVLGVAPAAAQADDDTVLVGDVDDAVADAAYVQETARALVDDLAEQHGVAVEWFWQAHREGTDASPYDRYVEAAPPATDLRAVLDGASEPVWVDAVHLDEDGTRLVAEALWRDLEPRLAAQGAWSG